MWLVVGLGNPGPKYELTRHNVGFLAIDAIYEALGGRQWSTQAKAEIAKVAIGDDKLILVKPQTFMNLSGESVQPLAAYYKVKPDHIIVLHDEVDLPYAEMKIQHSRGHGGHNGIRDIHKRLSTNEYFRIKMGVGRSDNPNIDTATHVLQRFNDSEMNTMRDFCERAAQAVVDIIQVGYQKAATIHHTKG